MFDVLIQLTVTGLAMGAVYALMAMGLLLLIRAAGLLNFAQGEIFMLGAYLGWMLTYQMNLPLPGIWIGLILLLAGFAVAYMFTVYWPLRATTWPTALTICSMGASTIIREAVQLLWGPIPLYTDPMIDGFLTIGSAYLAYQYLLTIAAAAILIAAVFLLFEKLYVGRIMQAAAQNKYVSEIIGIPTLITTMATYIIVMIISGSGGYLIAPAFYTTINLGLFQGKAFAGVVIGGWGSLKGAVIGALIVGLIESYSTMITTTYKDSIIFLVLLIMLIVRPQGIFKERVSDKA